MSVSVWEAQEVKLVSPRGFLPPPACEKLDYAMAKPETEVWFDMMRDAITIYDTIGIGIWDGARQGEGGQRNVIISNDVESAKKLILFITCY